MSDLSAVIADGSMLDYVPSSQAFSILRPGNFLLSAGSVINLFGPSPSAGQALIAASPSSASWQTLSLNSLSDVHTTAPSTNSVLQFNGTQWVNTATNAANAVRALDNSIVNITAAGAPSVVMRTNIRRHVRGKRHAINVRPGARRNGRHRSTRACLDSRSLGLSVQV